MKIDFKTVLTDFNGKALVDAEQASATLGMISSIALMNAPAPGNVAKIAEDCLLAYDIHASLKGDGVVDVTHKQCESIKESITYILDKGDGRGGFSKIVAAQAMRLLDGNEQFGVEKAQPKKKVAK